MTDPIVPRETVEKIAASSWSDLPVRDWDELRKNLALDLLDRMEEVERLKRNPEEHATDPPTDCDHKHARCESCRWPLWTEQECKEIEVEGRKKYHDFHGEPSPDDCTHCQIERLEEVVGRLREDANRFRALERVEEWDRDITLDEMDKISGHVFNYLNRDGNWSKSFNTLRELADALTEDD